MGKDVQTNALPTLFHFVRVRVVFQPHVPYLVKRKRSNWHVKAYVKLRPTNPGFTVSRYIIENSEEKMIRRLKAE